MSEIALEQDFPPTDVVMNVENNNEREVLEKVTKSTVDINVTATQSNDDDDQ